MPPIKQEELLTQLEVKVNQQLQQVLTLVEHLDKQTLLKPAPDGGWSIVQCLEHLNTYGNFYFPEIKKAIASSSKNEAEIVFKSTWLGSYFTQLMEPKMGTKKMKAFKLHIPARELDEKAVIAEFVAQQKTLLVLLQQAKRSDINKLKIPISLTRWIRLKLGDVFQFIIAHNQRHIVQAQRHSK